MELLHSGQMDLVVKDRSWLWFLELLVLFHWSRSPHQLMDSGSPSRPSGSPGSGFVKRLANDCKAGLYKITRSSEHVGTRGPNRTPMLKSEEWPREKKGFKKVCVKELPHIPFAPSIYSVSQESRVLGAPIRGVPSVPMVPFSLDLVREDSSFLLCFIVSVMLYWA